MRWGLKHSWAQGYDRAEKDLVGQVFKLIGLIRTTEQSLRSFYLFGEMEDGSRVEVYPYTEAEYIDWAPKVAMLGYRDLYYSLNNRPRVKPTSIPNIKNFYRISSQHVTLVESKTKGDNIYPIRPPVEEQPDLPLISEPLFKSRNGHVTEERWHELMSAPDIKHSCTACNNPIAIEHHRDIVWINDNCVLCETCGTDTGTLAFVKSYHQ